MGRVLACSDLHGMLNLYVAIKESLQPDDIVYFLGDAGDRGPQPWETIKAIAADPQFLYLRGNHEDMLMYALEDHLRGYPYSHNYSLLRQNGGKETYKQCIAENDVFKWYNFFKYLPNEDIYTNAKGEDIYLSHAGFTPWISSKGIIATGSNHSLIWDRNHIEDDWPEDEELKNIVVVHGHTPIPYLDTSFLYQPIELRTYWYCNNHKLDIDYGSVFTGACALIDLNTWEQTMFYTRPYYNILHTES